MLCAHQSDAEKYWECVFGTITQFRDLLLNNDLCHKEHYTLIIDEFQNL